jgi:hypothetical protein
MWSEEMEDRETSMAPCPRGDRKLLNHCRHVGEIATITSAPAPRSEDVQESTTSP